jgi:hypothetical protein
MMSDLHSQNETDATAKPAEEAPPRIPVVPDPTKDEKPTREARKQYRNRKFEKARVWIEFGCALALVGITWTYTHYARKQAIAATDAAKAAQETATAARDTLIASNRPWVGIADNLRFTNPPKFFSHDIQSPIEIRVDVSFKLKNYGGGPAMSADPDFFVMPRDTEEPPSRQELRGPSNCDGWKVAPKEQWFPAPSILIMPGTFEQPIEVNTQTTVPTTIKLIKRIWLRGCIVYRDRQGTPHVTKLLYHSWSLASATPVLAVPNRNLFYVPIGGWSLWSTEAE